ncbi:exo-alpha-sialidase [candidate division KSB1 bacterium]|nr:exo-alpha-sialidase [candidate division KSB1 bacterium]
MKEILLTLLFLIPLCMCMQSKPKIATGISVQQDLFNTALRPGVACFRIPALVTAPNGDLVAAIDERVPSCNDLGKNPNINIVIRRSQDDGSTWSEIETVADYPSGQSASDPSMIVDEVTGEILLFYNFMDVAQAPGIYHLHVLKSGDNGQTWSPPQDLTPQITKPKWQHDFKFITSGRGIQTRDGWLLHTMVNLDHGLHLFGSRDHGESWFLLETPIEPGDESKVVELADGRWMINSRVKGCGMRYVHISADQGKTWQTQPEPQLTDPACNASLIRYSSAAAGAKKNRLLFSNANRSDARANMTVRISYDEGKTWSAGRTIYAGHSAYSSLTVLRNGEIGLLFEKDDHTQNIFVRFSLAWLTDGADQTPEYKSQAK